MKKAPKYLVCVFAVQLYCLFLFNPLEPLKILNFLLWPFWEKKSSHLICNNVTITPNGKFRSSGNSNIITNAVSSTETLFQ